MELTNVNTYLPTSRAQSSKAPHHTALQHITGDTLFWEGDSAHTLFRLEAGLVRAFRYDEEGERQILALFWPGDIFGVPIDSGYSYSAEAVLPIQARAISIPDDCDLAGNRINTDMFEALSCEIRAFQTRSELVGRTGARVRLAAFLLHLSQTIFMGNDGDPIAMPQVDMADYLALTPETVCRTLQAMRSVGAIAMPRRDQICVTDEGQLKAMLH